MDTRTAYPSDLTDARVGPGLPRHPGPQAGRPARQARPPRDRQRPAVRRPHRLPVAGVAARLPALGDRVLVLPHLEEGRHLRPPDGPAPRRPAAGRGPATAAVGRHHRQPVGQDDRKRGPRGYDAGKKVNGRKRHILVDDARPDPRGRRPPGRRPGPRRGQARPGAAAAPLQPAAADRRPTRSTTAGSPSGCARLRPPRPAPPGGQGEGAGGQGVQGDPVPVAGGADVRLAGPVASAERRTTRGRRPAARRSSSWR